MHATWKRSEKLQREISDESNSEGRLKEMWNLRRQWEFSRSCLRERGIRMEISPMRGKNGEGVSIVSEVKGRKELWFDATIYTKEVEMTSKWVAEQSKLGKLVDIELNNKLYDIVANVH